MNKVKHTSGPWVARGNTVREVSTEAEEVICYTHHTYHNGNNKGQREANAQLIAAAPLLLEACKMALIEYRGLKDETDLVKLGCDGNDDACTNMLNYAIYEAGNV